MVKEGRLRIRIDKDNHEDLEAVIEFYSEKDKCWKMECHWPTINEKAYSEMFQKVNYYQRNQIETRIEYTFDEFVF